MDRATLKSSTNRRVILWQSNFSSVCYCKHFKTSVLVFFTFFNFLFFSACDSEETLDFPSEIIQDPRISDSVFNLLLDDSKLISLDYLRNEEMKELNSIEISEFHVAPILAALQMIYLDTLSPTISNIRNYHIHSLCPVQLHESTLTADTLHLNFISWARKGYSGNKKLDDLIKLFGLKIDSLQKEQFILVSEIGINQAMLSAELEKLPFISKAKPNYCAGDGSQIEIIEFTTDFIRLIYSHGWGDCPSGCINRHYWDIGVFGSGTIKILQEYGKPLP